jgi:hypothetical protein
MKIPEPIIEPATSMVESSNPSPRTNPPSLGEDCCDMMLCGSLDLIGHQPNDVVARKPGKKQQRPA